MADELVRIEGDFEYWRTEAGAEYRRWATGNSQGKAAHSFRDKHPGSAEGKRRAREGPKVAAEALARVASMGPVALSKAVDRIARAEAAQDAARIGLVRAVRDEGLRVRSALEAWGLLVGRQAVRALSGSPQAVTAVRFVGEATGLLAGGEAAPVQAVQVNVSIGGELADRYGAAAAVSSAPAELGAGALPATGEGGPALGFDASAGASSDTTTPQTRAATSLFDVAELEVGSLPRE